MSRINFAQLRAEDVKQGSFLPGTVKFPSRGLEQIWDHLHTGTEKKAILDLGRASRANIEFFANFRCTVVIEDFLGEFALQRATEGSPTPKQTLYSLLEGIATRPFDAIFAWDIFNYLDPKDASNFAQALTNIAAPDALLMMHVSAVTQVPAAPRCYRLLGKNEISEEIFSSQSANCSRYSQRDLSQFFQPWKLTRSVQLRNSMQEHLFQFDSKRVREPLPNVTNCAVTDSGSADAIEVVRA